MQRPTDQNFGRTLEQFVEAAIDFLDTLDGDADEEDESRVDMDLAPTSLNRDIRKPKVISAGRPGLV